MVDPAWASARLSYAGWVPNVGSHLSFSLIGSRAGKGVVRHSVRVEYERHIARVVCALQVRTTDDMLMPVSWALRKKPDLQQNWMLVGETDTIEVPTGIALQPKRPTTLQKLKLSPPSPPIDKVTTTSDEQGVLIGRILVVPYEENFERRQLQESILADVRRRLETGKAGEEGKQMILEAESLLRTSVSGVVVANFALMRTGETRIWFDRDHPQLDDESHRQIARQAYYFIKDMCHRHVHHDHLDDQITPLTIFKNSSLEERTKSEIDWRRETLWSLSRYADKRMVSERLNYLREALGMLAYADAFQNSLMKHFRDPNDALSYLPNKSAYGYDFQHIRDSTRVRIDQMAARRTVTGQLIAATFAGAIASLSLVSSLISTHNAKVAADGKGERYGINIWDSLLRFLGEFPLVAMFVSGFILWGAFAFYLSDVFSQSRRRFQLFRGVALTITRKNKISARNSFLLLVSFYIISIIILIICLIISIRFITDLPPDLELLILEKSKDIFSNITVC